MNFFKSSFVKVILAFTLVLALLSSAAFAAGNDVVTGAAYTVTANKDGTFTLKLNESLGAGESFTWMTLKYGNKVPRQNGFTLPADANGMVEVADELFAEMADIIDIAPIGNACFDEAISMSFAHGNTTSKTITLPKGSEVLFVGRTMPFKSDNYTDNYTIITLGGTKLNELKPGGTGGNDMTGDPVLPPDPGDHTNAMLWLSLMLSLMLVSASTLIVTRKRAKTR